MLRLVNTFTDAGGAQAYTYPVNSHRLSSVDGDPRTFDAAGNTLTIGTDWTYTYNAAGRLATASQGVSVSEYRYTGAGEQVLRDADGTKTLFLYDEAGQLLGQYDQFGDPLNQYVWLDRLPVGVITAAGELMHVQADHLGTHKPVAASIPSTFAQPAPVLHFQHDLLGLLHCRIGSAKLLARLEKCCGCSIDWVPRVWDLSSC